MLPIASFVLSFFHWYTFLRSRKKQSPSHVHELVSAKYWFQHVCLSVCLSVGLPPLLQALHVDYCMKHCWFIYIVWSWRIDATFWYLWNRMIHDSRKNITPHKVLLSQASNHHIDWPAWPKLTLVFTWQRRYDHMTIWMVLIFAKCIKDIKFLYYIIINEFITYNLFTGVYSSKLINRLV